MTCLATVYTKHGIIMAADSLKINVDNYANMKVLDQELVQKLFYINQSKTGISTIGFASWENKSIKQILSEYIESKDFSSVSQYEVALGLQKFMENNYPKLETSYQICGYDKEEPFVFELEFHNDKGLTLSRKNIDQLGSVKYNILAMCSNDTIEYARSHAPNFDSIDIEKAINFMKQLYNIELRSSRDVGEPIDYLILTPKGYHFPYLKGQFGAIL